MLFFLDIPNHARLSGARLPGASEMPYMLFLRLRVIPPPPLCLASYCSSSGPSSDVTLTSLNSLTCPRSLLACHLDGQGLGLPCQHSVPRVCTQWRQNRQLAKATGDSVTLRGWFSSSGGSLRHQPRRCPLPWAASVPHSLLWDQSRRAADRSHLGPYWIHSPWWPLLTASQELQAQPTDTVRSSKEQG